MARRSGGVQRGKLRAFVELARSVDGWLRYAEHTGEVIPKKLHERIIRTLEKYGESRGLDPEDTQFVIDIGKGKK